LDKNELLVPRDLASSEKFGPEATEDNSFLLSLDKNELLVPRDLASSEKFGPEATEDMPRDHDRLETISVRS
jgi:hypothetical protein